MEEVKTVETKNKPEKKAYDPEYALVCKLVKAIFAMADAAGFSVEDRITLKRKKTGRVFK